MNTAKQAPGACEGVRMQTARNKVSCAFSSRLHDTYLHEFLVGVAKALVSMHKVCNLGLCDPIELGTGPLCYWDLLCSLCHSSGLMADAAAQQMHASSSFYLLLLRQLQKDKGILSGHWSSHIAKDGGET